MRFSADDKVSHAHQWWKEGDHPSDEWAVEDDFAIPKGTFVKPFKGTAARPETQIHDACGASWAAHGKIAGVRDPVCPGSWIVEHPDGSFEVYRPNIYGLSYDPQGPEWMERPVKFYADCREHRTRKEFGSVTEAANYVHAHQVDTGHVSDVYMVETTEKATKKAAAKRTTRKKAEPKAKATAAKEPAEAAAEEEAVSSGN